MRAAWIAFLCVLPAWGCTGDDAVSLAVDLKTDLVAGIEFAVVRTEIDDASRDERGAFRGDSYLEGRRVAEVGGLAPGARALRVILLDGAGRAVAERVTRLSHERDFGLTVVITRDCAGVTCPGAMDDPTHLACVGGRCADPGCSELAPELCPMPECAAPTDCPTVSSCAAATCFEGSCLYDPDDTACAAGEYCAVESGCLVEPVADAGVFDDADARDAGVDAGQPDAGPADGGPDAGPTPIRLPIAGGGTHTCAVRPTGQLACWGANDLGQLGLGTTSDGSAVPVDNPSLGSTTSIAAAIGHTCAVDRGDAHCFGWTASGAIGEGTNDFAMNRPTPVNVLTGARAVGAGLAGSCAVTAAGGVQCWGDLAGVATPTPIAGLSGVTDVAVGQGFACAASAQLRCWGENASGQLGIGTTGGAMTSPVAVTGLPPMPVAALDAYDHACAVIGGDVYCWGNNDYGQAGGSTPTAPTPLRIGVRPAVDVATSHTSTCTVEAMGTVVCWGRNNLGQLGIGSPSEMEPPSTVVGIADATTVGAGANHFCAGHADGRISCWGANANGQLGIGRSGNESSPQAVVGFP